MIIAVDHSLRGTAAVALTQAGEVFDRTIISPAKTISGVELVAYHQLRFSDFIAKVKQQVRVNGAPPVRGVVLEGLSHSSVGSSKDVQAGIFWTLQTVVYLNHPELLLGVIPVTMWRASVLSKEEQREAKQHKDGLKKACVAKLPTPVRDQFAAFVQANEEYLRAAKASQWKDCIYDLTDAYWLGQYRKTLS